MEITVSDNFDVKSLYGLTQLNTLNLYGITTTSIPTGIGQLKRLSKLTIRVTAPVTLLADIIELKRLKTFWLTPKCINAEDFKERFPKLI